MVIRIHKRGKKNREEVSLEQGVKCRKGGSRGAHNAAGNPEPEEKGNSYKVTLKSR